MEFIGYEWLARRYGTAAVQPLPSRAAISKVRTQSQDAEGVLELFPAVMRPLSTLPSHLTFAIKHEGVHLEALARLFAAIDPRELEAWFASEPTGQYARRSCFLYEWLTGGELRVQTVVGGNYVEALDPERCLVNQRPTNVPRWRVRNNLPGTREFCPTVRWTHRTRQVAQYECARQIHKIESEFGSEAMADSSSQMALEEGSYSFALEGESEAAERIRRFAQWMHRHCGEGEVPLRGEALAGLQRRLLAGGTATGLRNGQAFVITSEGAAGIDYIAPDSPSIAGMLDGLAAFEAGTARQSSVLRASVMFFGFGFIHPLANGNGLVSRYLINDTLRRDGAVQEPFVLPVSIRLSDTHMAPITAQEAVRRYAGALTKRFAAQCVRDSSSPSGMRFDGHDQARATWAYPDLTAQAEYLGQAVAETVEQEVRRLVAARREELRVRAAIQEIVSAPDDLVDQLMRELLLEADVSQDLLEQLPALDDAGTIDQVLEILGHSALPGAEGLRRTTAPGARPRG
jgi:hypothetical protein